jgi:hypothetical protein
MTPNGIKSQIEREHRNKAVGAIYVNALNKDGATATTAWDETLEELKNSGDEVLMKLSAKAVQGILTSLRDVNGERLYRNRAEELAAKKKAAQAKKPVDTVTKKELLDSLEKKGIAVDGLDGATKTGLQSLIAYLDKVGA